MEDARALEEAIVRKRAELEESTIRIEEIRAALAQREAVLANPAPRRIKVGAQRQAAQALWRR